MCSNCLSVFFCVFLGIVTALAEPDACPVSNSEVTSVKVRDAVLCNYDSNVGPINSQSPTNVTFRIILKYFFYEPLTSTLSFDSWLVVTWQDKHLSWKPSDYDNLKYIYLHTHEIWTPDIAVYNRANLGEDPLTVGYTKCIIFYKGTVICVPPSRIDALCVPNMSRYPFDTHNCTLKLGSWNHKGEEMNLRIPKVPVSSGDLTSNGEWKIDSFKALRHDGKYKCCPNESYPHVEINFKISRLSASHSASVVIPIIVAVMLTFTTLSMSPLNGERITISYVNIIAHFLQIQYISFIIPMKGEDVPLIVIFGRDSLLLAVFGLICTLVFKNLMNKKTTPPGWISTVISGCLCGRLGQILLMNDFTVTGAEYVGGDEDREKIVSSETSSKSEEWLIFAKILDKFLLLGYIIGYFIMFLKFLP